MPKVTWWVSGRAGTTGVLSELRPGAGVRRHWGGWEATSSLLLPANGVAPP